MTRAWLAIALLAATAATDARSDPAATALEALDKCAQQLTDHPDELEPYICVWRVAAQTGSNEDAARLLEARLALEPDNPRALLYLAVLLPPTSSAESEAMIRRAVEGFAREEQYRGEVYARQLLANRAREREQLDTELEQLRRAEVAAQSAGDPDLLTDVRLSLAQTVFQRGEYGLALVQYREIEDSLTDETPWYLRARALGGLAGVHWHARDHRKAFDFYRREAQIVQGFDLGWHASSLRNIALAAAAVRTPRRFSTGELRELTQRAIDAAILAKRLDLEASARTLHGQILEGPAAIHEFEHALRLARQVGSAKEVRDAQRQLALAFFQFDRSRADEAHALLERAISSARRVADRDALARCLFVRSAMLWLDGDRDQSRRELHRALDQIEAIRDLQRDEFVRARSMQHFAFAYRRFAALLTQPESSIAPADVALSLRVMERMRARVLLDALDSSKITASLGSEVPQSAERDRLLAEIAEVQGRLLDPRLPERGRERALEELSRLETEEMRLRLEIAEGSPRFRAARLPRLVSIEDVQATLAEDEALVSFVITEEDKLLGERIGSRSVIVTAEDARSFSLPKTENLADRVMLLRGLAERRDGSEAAVSRDLGEHLLVTALRELPPRVDRLIIVPDGPLFRLPFGLLRNPTTDRPLAMDYDLSIVPSATIWSRWRTTANTATNRTALSYAYSRSDGSGTAASILRQGDLTTGLELTPLSHARTEAQMVARRFDGDAMQGEAASEKHLKAADLEPYGLLHFAAHAVIDEQEPQRSAVILAASENGEDGLLQPREIVQLKLADKVVLLSACSSASGSVIDGEGVLGLARAFLQGGARAVIGSLWPLHDDEAAEFMGELSRKLAGGASLDTALAATKRAWIDDGRPAQSWAGYVLIGDGAHVPFPSGVRSRNEWTVLDRRVVLAVSVALVLLAGAFLLRRRARRTV